MSLWIYRLNTLKKSAMAVLQRWAERVQCNGNGYKTSADLSVLMNIRATIMGTSITCLLKENIVECTRVRIGDRSIRACRLNENLVNDRIAMGYILGLEIDTDVFNIDADGSSDHVVTIPSEVKDCLKKNISIFITTFGRTGDPLIEPNHFTDCNDRYSFVSAIEQDSRTFKNLVAFPQRESKKSGNIERRASITVIGEGNTSLTFLCRYGAIRAPSFTHPSIYLFRFDVITVRDLNTPLRIMKNGPYTTPICWESEFLTSEMRKEVTGAALRM